MPPARSIALVAALALGGAGSVAAAQRDDAASPVARVAAGAPTPEAKPLYPLPAAPAYPKPCPPPPRKGGGRPAPPPRPKVKEADLPRPLAVAKRRVDLGPVTGKGMWMTTWADTKVDVPAVVAQAKAAGLRQLWVRTGGYRQGWYGTDLLERLLPAAHAAGLAVIAWDFPAMSDPMVDVARARKAFGTFAGHRIDGFSPDIETINEGAFNSPRRVRLYLSHVRRAAGNTPVISTVMRPTPAQLASYPYAEQAPYIDAFAPMVYWSCNEPGRLAQESVAALARLRPVHLIGQSYDMGGEGGRPGMPTGREIWRFLDVAKRAGAIGASLYNHDEAGRPQWRSLSRYPWQKR